MSRYRYAGDKGERKNSSNSFLTTAIDGVSVSATPWPRFTPGKRPQVPIV
jgi:hypothetical protein